MSQGFTKLFGSIVLSTIWREPSPTRLLWITMLAVSDANGEVMASVPGLADLARITLKETEAGLASLMGPDEYSRSKENEGRRIEEIDGGWSILNYRKYREKMSAEDRRQANNARQKRWRDRQKESGKHNAECRRKQTQAEAEAEADKNPPTLAVLSPPGGHTKNVTKPVTNWRIPPEDWTPAPSIMTRATERGLDAQVELEKFRTFEQRQVPTDWNLPFKRWILSATPKPKESPGYKRPNNRSMQQNHGKTGLEGTAGFIKVKV